MEEASLKCEENKSDDEEMEVLRGEGVSLMDVLASTEEEVKLSTKLKLKELPYHLKYVYLDEEEKKSVIISSGLEKEEEDLLVVVLKTVAGHSFYCFLDST